ncbi:MAG: peptidoglycan bridge formation glycyltransferase FemA/FemB family protein [Chloroflexi bacterium]|nr:MAG: peptidoglycan bridge formation glycyltransferase FemA/FemB family protein [Chloroflexota bacterium]MBL1195303.1 peptidoglycan bridge formation glycyltransferase FemA/FemB family protein [Chloroflexota bacterium]NOH12587.1 peptidoglycan bridge formation glycyltransferase FemA/FemB family protein [Chloroflexota bacterium]
MPIVTQADWLAFAAHHPQAHLLQSAAWGELKSEFGWRTTHILAGESGVQVLTRSLPLGFSLAYIPKGPVGGNWDALWPEIDHLCRSSRAVFLKVEPDHWVTSKTEDTNILPNEFRPSRHSIQPRRTVVVDLSPDEDAILAIMKQKTRYNIRLAQRKDVEVRATDDIDAFYEMMTVTGQRDGFGVHTKAYYQRAYDLFHPLGMCELLLAEYQGQPLAGLMAFASGPRSWYLYGASTNQERNRMPTYLLQWAAMRWAKSKGCTEYDLYGVPDEDQTTLEENFTQRSDGLWGVYRFKRGFGGELKRAVSAFDKVYIPWAYWGYQAIVARRGLGD